MIKAVITGAGNGLWRAFCEAVVPAQLIAADISPAAAEETATRLGIVPRR